MNFHVAFVLPLLSGGCLAFAACPAGSPASWVDTGIAGPPARQNHAMAFDSTRQRVVLFGGRSPSGTLLNDLWEFDGTQWVDRTLPSMPIASYGHIAYFWPALGETFIVGGHVSTGTSSAAWYYNGTRWASVFLYPPGGREFAAVAIDPVRGRAVMHGGTAQSVAPNSFTDTWDYDGSAWVRRSTGGSGGHSGHAMAFDAGRNQVVSVGGATSSLFHTLFWRPASNSYDWGPNGNLPLRKFNSLAYDPDRQRLVVFGGLQNDGCTSCATLTDTRELAATASSWTLANDGTSGVGGSNGSAMVYLPAFGNWPGGIMRFGGLDASGNGDTRTWIWKSSCCPSDLNGDGGVDDADFTIFAAAYNTLDCADPSMAPGCPADLNSDAFVDDADFTAFVVAYNALLCP